MFKKLQERYTNENLKKQVKQNLMAIHFVIVLFILAIFLPVRCLVVTSNQNKAKNPIPFETMTKGPFFNIYYAELTETPESIGSGYYKAIVDDTPVVLYLGGLVNRVENEINAYGSSTVHGSVMFADESMNSTIASIEGLGRYKDENRYVCLDCYDDNLWNETIKRNAAGPVFGIVSLILGFISAYMFGTFNIFKHFRPACGSTKFTIEEINEQANMEGSVWVSTFGIYLTPNTMIGTAKGMTVVEYTDIDSIGVRGAEHSERDRYRVMDDHPERHYREYKTYRLIVMTKNGQKLTFADSKINPGGDPIYTKCKEKNPSLVIDELDF